MSSKDDTSSSGSDKEYDDSKGDSEGASLAAELFKLAQSKGVSLNAEDLEDDDEDDDEEDEDDDVDAPVAKRTEPVATKESKVGDDDDDDEDEDDDEEEINYPAGAINAFLGYDTGGDAVGGLAGNVTLTDNQLYSEVKERVLDTAGGFVKFVKGAKEEEEEDDEDGDDEEGGLMGKKKVYSPPETVPDSDLTAGEVVYLVLDALLNNDVPTTNRGVEILFGYSSPGSSIKNEQGLTPDEYAAFLKETEYKVLFNHQGVSIDKADYSFDGKKAFFTARLQAGPGPLDTVSVNFILSTTGREDDACWLIDSLLIRPQSMRRRRRK
jgi:hypothetical protein